MIFQVLFFLQCGNLWNAGAVLLSHSTLTCNSQVMNEDPHLSKKQFLPSLITKSCKISHSRHTDEAQVSQQPNAFRTILLILRRHGLLSRGELSFNLHLSTTQELPLNFKVRKKFIVACQKRQSQKFRHGNQLLHRRAFYADYSL